MARKRSKAASRQMREQIVGYITAAFGLVAGLAWDDAISELISTAFPAARTTVIAKFTYAVILTIVVALVTTVFIRMQRKNK